MMSVDARPVILVLEESEPLRRAICSALTAEGFEVRAPSDRAAWQDSARTEPRVVLIDLAGYSAENAARLVEAFQPARIVAIEPPEELRGRVARIPLPFSLSALVGAVAAEA